MSRYFAPLVFTLVIAAIPIIVTPKVASQQTPKEQEQNEQQPSDLQTNPNPQVDQGSQQQGQGGSKNKENNQRPKEGLWEWFLNVSASNDKAIVAISTIVIAAFTALLFIATILLWSGGERHSERELRAYLSATPFMVLNWGMEKEFIGVDCHFENHGQTPAFEVNHVFQIAIAEGFNPELPPADIPVTQNNVVFPHSFLSTRFFLHRPLTKEEIRDVEEGKRRMHCWGVTTYRDAFRIHRPTRFARSVGGPDLAGSARALRQGKSGVPIRWANWTAHNDAT